MNTQILQHIFHLEFHPYAMHLGSFPGPPACATFPDVPCEEKTHIPYLNKRLCCNHMTYRAEMSAEYGMLLCEVLLSLEK